MKIKTHLSSGSLVSPILLALRKDQKEGVNGEEERKNNTEASDVTDDGIEQNRPRHAERGGRAR